MSETEILWALRALPRELDPPRDLWPGIADGIASTAAAPAAPRRRNHMRWITPLAMAASVLLTVGIVSNAQHAAHSPAADPAGAIESRVVASESRAVTDEYQAALRQFEGAPVAPEIKPALKALDKSVEQIRRAIAADPDSVFLLEQLRRSYELRLSLTQRAITS